MASNCRSVNCKMTKWKIGAVCGTALLIAAVVVVAFARRRDLPEKDVAALLVYLRRADDAMRIERVAALKNDVMNLLRNQEPPPKGLAETLIGAAEFARCKQWKLGMTCFPL